MSKITRFEDLRCWQASRLLTNYVYDLCELQPLSHKFELRNQLERAAISVMNNISEGFGRLYKKEMIKFLNIASSSCCELRSLSYLLSDRGIIEPDKFEKFQKMIETTYLQILGFIRYLHQKLIGEKVAKPGSKST